MRGCSLEPGSFPEVHLLLAVMEEHAQGVYTLCNPCVKRKMSSERSRTPSCCERFCKHLSGGVTWDGSREGIGVYCRPKIRN
jgi:hypothetical protein